MVKHIRGAICIIGVAMLVFVGCKSFDSAGLFFLQKDSGTGDRVVVGSLDAVAESAKSSLTQLGFAAVADRQGEAVRINCKTANGSRFTLVLTREPKQGDSAQDKTRVRIEWDGKSDDQTSLQVLSQVEATTRK